jgi:hypothetical protein
LIDVEVANDPDPAANTAVPAEFAGFFAVEGFIGDLGLKRSCFNTAFRKAVNLAADGGQDARAPALKQLFLAGISRGTGMCSKELMERQTVLYDARGFLLED